MIKFRSENLQEFIESMIIHIENKIPEWIIESLYFKDILEARNERLLT